MILMPLHLLPIWSWIGRCYKSDSVVLSFDCSLLEIVFSFVLWEYKPEGLGDNYFIANLTCLYLQKTSWKNLFAYMGPGFLVSIAYIDPGNCKITTSQFVMLTKFDTSPWLSFDCICYSWNWSTVRSSVQVWGMDIFFLFRVYLLDSFEFGAICIWIDDEAQVIALLLSIEALLNSYRKSEVELNVTLFVAVAMDHISGFMCGSCHSIPGSKPGGCYRLMIFKLIKIFFLSVLFFIGLPICCYDLPFNIYLHTHCRKAFSWAL